MTNKYFSEFQEPSEQSLVDDLIQEAIQAQGMDLYYIPRTQRNTNPVLGEDTTSTFNAAYLIEMYLESTESFEGDKNWLGKIGLTINKSMNLLVSDVRFKETINAGPFNVTTPTVNLNYERPLEGSLIWFPLTKGLFEIKFADHEIFFYQLGKIYAWRITCELYQYSNEVFSTGIPEIDAVQTRYTNPNSIVNDPIADNTNVKTKLDAILDPNSPKDPYSLSNY